MAKKDDNSISGFNIVINNGKRLVKTYFTATHLIPRRENDVANPKAGVMHQIPVKE